jgi:hypothetical protein
MAGPSGCILTTSQQSPLKPKLVYILKHTHTYLKQNTTLHRYEHQPDNAVQRIKPSNTKLVYTKCRVTFSKQLVHTVTIRV